MRSLADIDAEITETRATLSRIRTRGQAEGHDGAQRSQVSYKDLVDHLRELERERGFTSGRGGVSFTPTIGGG